MGSKRFPLFVDLTGRNALVVGGGPVGVRRARALRRFGATVTLVSPALAEPVEGVRYLPRGYQPGDLAGMFLAVAATDAPGLNAALGREARRLGVLFNRADCPADCDFFFPALCEGKTTAVGVAGDGSDHRRTARIAARVRELLEEIDT